MATGRNGLKSKMILGQIGGMRVKYKWNSNFQSMIKKNGSKLLQKSKRKILLILLLLKGSFTTVHLFSTSKGPLQCIFLVILSTGLYGQTLSSWFTRDGAGSMSLSGFILLQLLYSY